jgi:ABC-type multidrug transport system ATPase subunit
VARGLGKRFGQAWAVAELSFEVARGEIFGLLGPNGAGKTTTLRLLSGLIAPSAGGGRVAGFELGRQDEAVRRNVGLLPGEPGLYEALSAEANLDFHARLQGLSAARRRQRVQACLETVSLWDRRRQTVGTFSKGMKQRLALARTLLHEPPVLLLDEPTAGADPVTRDSLLAVVAARARAGAAVCYTTHYLPELDQLAATIAVAARGRVIARGDRATLVSGLTDLQQPSLDDLYRRLAGGADDRVTGGDRVG